MASHQHIADLSTEQQLTVPASARVAWVQAETEDVRYTLDGSTPSATNGLLMYAGDPPTVLTIEAGLAEAKFIETTASAKLNVAYF